MTVLTSHQKTKILTSDVRLLIKALEGKARVVGGAVRDALMEREVGDIDLATSLPPDKAIQNLNAAGIKTAPTGLAHGTVTAIVDRKGYEITTLRRDAETDGRRAKVIFTDNWEEDGSRRDFTMNALYADTEGNVVDYFEGLEDAKAGRVKFIGDARARIREDVLRILRFFRFYAWFGKGEADKEALEACRDLAALIPNLSAERIAKEFMKLLGADNPLPALKLMEGAGALSQFMPAPADFTRLQTLLEAESAHKARQTALVRLAALLPQDESAAYGFAQRLKFSNRDAATLCTLAGLPAIMRERPSPAGLRELIYRYGAESCRNAAFLNGGKITEAHVEKMTSAVSETEVTTTLRKK